MKKILSAAAIALLTLTPCGTDIEQDATYDTGAELAEAINSVDDFGCDTEPLEHLLEEHGWLNIPCRHSVAALYGSDEKREEIYRKNPLETGERRLTGPNWSYTNDQYAVEAVQEVLGGAVES